MHKSKGNTEGMPRSKQMRPKPLSLSLSCAKTLFVYSAVLRSQTPLHNSPLPSSSNRASSPRQPPPRPIPLLQPADIDTVKSPSSTSTNSGPIPVPHTL